MALKPLPKLIIIGVVVGGIGYGLMNFNLGALLPKKSAAPAVEVTTVPAVQQEVHAVPALQQASETPPPRPTTADSGLSAVLGAGKK
jgi:hypothetical protein